MLVKVKPVEGNKELVKDTVNKAVINTDTKGYREYINRRNLKKNQDSLENRIETLEDNINTLKSDLNNLTVMLKKVLEI